MSEQLALIEAPPKLTDRQQFALELVQRAGTDGVHAEEIGAAWHAHHGKHDADARCMYDGSNGKQVLNELKRKGLVRYRRGNASRPGFWLAVGARDVRPVPPGMSDEIPY